MNGTTAQRTKVPTERTADGFHKSRHSNSQGACVEVREGATTAIRDTQNRGLGHIDVSAGAWARTLAALR